MEHDVEFYKVFAEIKRAFNSIYTDTTTGLPVTGPDPILVAENIIRAIRNEEVPEFEYYRATHCVDDGEKAEHELDERDFAYLKRPLWGERRDL